MQLSKSITPTSPIATNKLGVLNLNTPDVLGRTWISSASGLTAFNGSAWAVSDEYGDLAKFESLQKPGQLFAGIPAQKIGRKPDLESLLSIPQANQGALLVAFGSGSAKDGTRDVALVQKVDYQGKLLEAASSVDLSKLYKALEQKLDHGVNIEAAAMQHQNGKVSDLLLFQRGRTTAESNTIFRLDAKRAVRELSEANVLSKDLLKESVQVDLGTIDGAQLGFSDAVALDDGRVVFTASAELKHKGKTDDPYKDGQIMGSVIGVLSPELKLEKIARLQGEPRKVEGIIQAKSLSPQADPNEFLLVTDPDNPSKASELLSVKIN